MDYLQLTTAGLKCLLPLSTVEEIFSLPELTVIPEAPNDILGVLNLRGDLIPIMHLSCRLGITPPQCRETDVVIVLRATGLRVGVVVHQVEDVILGSTVELRQEPDYGHPGLLNTAFVAGLAQVAEEVLILINVDTLIRAPVEVARLTSEGISAELEHYPSYDFYDRYWPTATLVQRALLRQRQQALCHQVAFQEPLGGTLTAVVFALEGEQFAIPLGEIQQFIEVNHLVPAPKAPSFIAGHVSLQNEVISLLDLRELLRLPQSPAPLKKAVVLKVNSMLLGVLVNDVQGIISYLSQEVKLSSFLAVHDSGYVGSIIEEGRVIKLLNINQLVNKLIVPTKVA
ncbi:chemotaxis signal transuction system adapter protein CheW family [Thermosynechococcus sp. NK55a]|nr:chemotaxis signal transuction system adapter protein CheW family [Thermosynechococcus sp. NK55a]RMH65449.1 MAG: hypothetical protein D6676_07380 [Cyanobacteria bacterium J003]